MNNTTMTQNETYFRKVYRRFSIKLILLSLFYQISSWPRLVIEVFIRKNMGERYFSIGQSIIIFLLLATPAALGMMGNTSALPFLAIFNAGFTGLGIFALLFLVMALVRWWQIRTGPQTIDFEKFSLSSGEFTGLFRGLNNKGVSASLIEKWLEPLTIIILGIGLLLAPETRLVGLLLIFCSVIYSLSYMGAYAMSRSFILDKIDERISGEEMADALQGKPAGETKGFRTPGVIQNDESIREQIYNAMMDLDGEPAAAAV